MDARATVQPLAYSPPPPFHRRRRWRRGALLVVLVIAAIAAWRWGPWAWERGRLLYWQRQCLTYSPPPDQIVYEGAFAAAQPLIARGVGWRAATIPPFSGTGTPLTVAAYDPPCWAKFGALAGVPPSLPSTGATVFLHERRGLDGRPILVHVAFVTDGTGVAEFVAGYDLDPTLFEPGGWTRLPTTIRAGYEIDLMSGPVAAPPVVRVYAGQPDPADPAHFTIRYEMWGQEDVVDGWVGSSGNVRFETRKRPEPRMGNRR